MISGRKSSTCARVRPNAESRPKRTSLAHQALAMKVPAEVYTPSSRGVAGTGSLGGGPMPLSMAPDRTLSRSGNFVE
jgi:hypothetical protein